MNGVGGVLGSRVSGSVASPLIPDPVRLVPEPVLCRGTPGHPDQQGRYQDPHPENLLHGILLFEAVQTSLQGPATDLPDRDRQKVQEKREDAEDEPSTVAILVLRR